MKHLFRGLLFVAVILCCNFQQAFAQQMPPIPIDKNVRIGKLDNGLTYYIRTNVDWHTFWNICVSMEPLTSRVMR